ncbi:MAG: sigma 54-interacting transcriptional regulator [Phycisphaerae bacterium]|nr:sigma 54-interacting transcriptional regulator [Phycisphaerae bacterium]
MSEALVAELFAALDCVVLRRRDDRTFAAVGSPPTWFNHHFLTGDDPANAIRLAEKSAFLTQFIDEAAQLWGGGKPGRLVSAAWSEPAAVSSGYYFQAEALSLPAGAFLVISRCGADIACAMPQWSDLANLRADCDIAELSCSENASQVLAARLEAALALVAHGREDMIAILNQLRIAIVMTDHDGRLTFLSETCQGVLGTCERDVLGRHWREVCPWGEDVKSRLAESFVLPPDQREKLVGSLVAPSGRQYWMEIEVRDDPRDPRRKIFFLYDVTEVHDLRRMLEGQAHFHDLVGKSKSMRAVYQQIQDLARVDTIVLIEGATGTGKELVAHAIHSCSQRKDKPFVAVNCAGLTDSLLGSHLFGHKRGAFTGAIEDQKGVFEEAAGGTVFLDEIGDISNAVQTSMLRVLQEREITRLGEARPRKVDVRIIAATHRDLHTEVEAGRFRMDLLYRIRVARIALPALCERREDIALLASEFLNRSRAATGKRVEGISEPAMGLLLDYAWPGNVRELQSAVEFAVIRSGGPVIQPEDLPPEIARGTPVADVSRANEPEGDERARILSALKSARGNRSVAARMLGFSRSTFYRRLTELGIELE